MLSYTLIALTGAAIGAAVTFVGMVILITQMFWDTWK